MSHWCFTQFLWARLVTTASLHVLSTCYFVFYSLFSTLRNRIFEIAPVISQKMLMTLHLWNTRYHVIRRQVRRMFKYVFVQKWINYHDTLSSSRIVIQSLGFVLASQAYVCIHWKINKWRGFRQEQSFWYTLSHVWTTHRSEWNEFVLNVVSTVVLRIPPHTTLNLI
jgi:hypothetical protein